MSMGQKGLDFKHKEVININDGRRLRLCSRCMRRLRKWNNYFYDGTLIENRKKLCNGSTDEILENDKCLNFVFERSRKEKSYITKNNQSRTGYILKEKFEYDVICKVEL